jgi:hypothetical protein
MNKRGIIIIPLTFFFLICTSGLIICAHYISERKKALKHVEKLQKELRKKPQMNF